MDQFSRNLFRNQAKSFATDYKAQKLCLAGIEHELDHQLSLVERVFFYMPLMHAEDVQLQEYSVRAFQSLLELSLAETKSVYENFLSFAVKHYDIVKEFGRFPHRNSILERETSKSEETFIQEHGRGF